MVQVQTLSSIGLLLSALSDDDVNWSLCTYLGVLVCDTPKCLAPWSPRHPERGSFCLPPIWWWTALPNSACSRVGRSCLVVCRHMARSQRCHIHIPLYVGIQRLHFQIFHVDVGHYWRQWWSHGYPIQLFVKRFSKQGIRQFEAHGCETATFFMWEHRSLVQCFIFQQTVDITSIASATGTLMNRLTTSKQTSLTLSFIAVSCIFIAKSAELLM